MERHVQVVGRTAKRKPNMQRIQSAMEDFLTRVVEHLIGVVSGPIKGEKPMKAKKAIMITVLGLIMSLGAMPAASQEKPSDNMQVVILL
jgi:hypothetical protein